MAEGKKAWRRPLVTSNQVKSSLFSVMPDKNYLTVDEFRKMWKSEFLPSIRREVKLEIETIRASIQALTDRSMQSNRAVNAVLVR